MKTPMAVALLRGINHFHHSSARCYSQISALKSVLEKCPQYMQLCKEFETVDPTIAEHLINSMSVYPDFLSTAEEKSLMDEVDPFMKKFKYQFDHWDDAIHGYRERERLEWNEENKNILNKVRKIAFPPEVAQLEHVHVLDLDKKGYIKPHIDAVRFCGDTIAGLSLLTDSVMRLVNDKNKKLSADILLKRRSLYIMKGAARFEYTHEILGNDHSEFDGVKIEKDRRISVICRNKPESDCK